MNTITRRARLARFFAPQAQSAVSPSEKLELTGLDLFPLREPVLGRSYSVLRAQTRSGLSGFGECQYASGEDLDAARQFWLGKPATSFALPHTALALDAALDMALLDITARAVNSPAYRLLGGPTRHKVRAFTSVEAGQVNNGWEAGFRVFAVSYQADVVKTCTAIRDRGADFVITSDGALPSGEAANVAAAIQPLHPLWFDEPCLVSDRETMRKISVETVVPLGFGHAIYDPEEFQELLREGLVDTVRPELALYGISGCRRIAALAETYYVAVSPRHDGGPVATAAALQLAATLPNFFIQHIPLPDAPEDREMRRALTGEDIEKVADGFASLTRAPGLGITINQAALEKYHAA